MNKLKIIIVFLSLVVTACTNTSVETVSVETANNDSNEVSIEAASDLSAVIASRSKDLRVRDSSRHPKETLEFFGLQPGMKVAEVLPGGGWYTQIIAGYLGSKGAIYGINYADDMWEKFGFFSDEVITRRIASSDGFEAMVNGFSGSEDVTAKGYAFKRIDPSLAGSLDAVFFIRALHNLNRFESSSNTLSDALQEVYGLLKPGGIVGVVQHRAPEELADDWASGKNGYLKPSYVIKKFEENGFKLVDQSEVNANPKDQPSEADYVWRLPPSLRTADENKAAMSAIGESDRMTLKFVKP